MYIPAQPRQCSLLHLSQSNLSIMWQSQLPRTASAAASEPHRLHLNFGHAPGASQWPHAFDRGRDDTTPRTLMNPAYEYALPTQLARLMVTPIIPADDAAARRSAPQHIAACSSPRPPLPRGRSTHAPPCGYSGTIFLPLPPTQTEWPVARRQPVPPSGRCTYSVGDTALADYKRAGRPGTTSGETERLPRQQAEAQAQVEAIGVHESFGRDPQAGTAGMCSSSGCTSGVSGRVQGRGRRLCDRMLASPKSSEAEGCGIAGDAMAGETAAERVTARLHRQLDAYAARSEGQLFLGRYTMLGRRHRRRGGASPVASDALCVKLCAVCCVLWCTCDS